MARMLPDPTFYPSPRMASEAPAETLAYVALLDRRARTARRTRSASSTPIPTSADYGTARRQARLPERRQRAAPLRLERVQLAPVRVRAQPAHGAALSGACRGRTARASTSSTRSPIRATPRLVKVIEGEEVMREDGIRGAAHGALRSRRHLHQRARRAGRRRPGRHLHARPRDVRGAGRVGARARPAVPRLRLLVAPRPRHDDHERVGDAQHGGERRQPRAAARRQVRQRAARVGPAAPHAPADARAWAPSSRWCSSCGRRTTRDEATASSAWCSA